MLKLNRIWLCSSVPCGEQWASRVSESERGGVEKNGVAFAEANASRFFERSRYENLIRLLRDYGAAVAQGTHNPLVVGSNPSGPK